MLNKQRYYAVARWVRVVAFTLFMPAVAGAQGLLWSAGMEKGDLNEWSSNGCGGVYNSGTAKASASTVQANSGSWSAKLEITTPSNPTSGTRLFRWCESHRHSELFYRGWYFLPLNYRVMNFWNVWQYKSKTSTRNDPFFVLNIGNRVNGAMYLYLHAWQTRQSYIQTRADVPVGRWFQVEAFYKCSSDSTGQVSFWQDGTLLFDVKTVQTRYADGDCQWSLDNYSDDLQPPSSSIYIDDAAISLTRVVSPR